MLDRRGGEARQVTDVKQNLSDYRWSPDAKQLLLTLREKDEPESDDKNAKPKPPKPIVIDRYHFKQDIEGYLTDKHAQLYLFDIATKKLTKLTSDAGKYDEQEAEWSPDGTMIAFVSNQSQPDPDRVENDDVFVVGCQGGIDVAQADDISRHGRRAAGLEPGQQADCVSAGTLRTLHRLRQQAAGGGAGAWRSRLS